MPPSVAVSTFGTASQKMAALLAFVASDTERRAMFLPGFVIITGMTRLSTSPAGLAVIGGLCGG